MTAKRLQYLIIHCTATPEERDVTKEDIIHWHTAPKPSGRGWKQVGYSDMISIDGCLINLNEFNTNQEVENWEVTNGVRGINGVSRHLVYVGGLDKKFKPKDTRTKAQRDALTDYVRYTVRRHPEIIIAGHNQFDGIKQCPSFDVPCWLKEVGIKEENIYKV